VAEQCFRLFRCSAREEENKEVEHNRVRYAAGPKRNPRVRGTTGRNHRSGATDIIEVTHMSNIICCICN
jgi:hypothetical protein